MWNVMSSFLTGKLKPFYIYFPGVIGLKSISKIDHKSVTILMAFKTLSGQISSDRIDFLQVSNYFISKRQDNVT